jgi:SAM-dependent methyltransferase
MAPAGKEQEVAGHSPDEVTEFERETWNRCAQNYRETFVPLTNEAVELLLEAANVQSGTRILDLGCGPGNVAARLAGNGGVVDAVDYSEPMLEVAKENYPDIRFHFANAEELPFDDGTFDAVISSLTVHHLARPTEVFKEVYRVLKPGGSFFWAVWGPEEEQAGFGVFFGALLTHSPDLDMSALPFGPLFGFTDRETYEPYVNGAGLTDFQLDAHKVTWKPENLGSVLRGMSDWSNLAAFPEELQEKVKASTRDNAKAFEKDGKYEFPHSLVVGRATRS